MKKKETETIMPYHQLDERWPLFGCKDYESYLEKYLVQGFFHEGVPDDVKESYKIVEHLIAYAWYHYPIYDEALNKVLRTFELAIKKKCDILSIPTEKVNTKNISKPKPLVDLIEEICNLEPNKHQSIFLNYLRDLRNSLMHPSQHYYAGGIMFGKILLAVNIINILFAPENIIVSLEALRVTKQKELNPFENKTLILDSDNKPLLIQSMSFCDAFDNGNDEIILVHIDPVYVLNDEVRQKKGYPKTIPYEIVNPLITSEQLSGMDLNTGLNISITITISEDHLKTSKDFKEYLYDLKTETPASFNPYLTNRMHDIGNSLQKFRYKHYQSLKINS